MSDNQILGPAYYIKHVIIISVFSGLASVAVILRVWARRIQKMSLELNDYLIVFGLLFALGNSALNIYGCSFGMARHMSQTGIMKAMVFSQKASFVSIIIWVASVTFIRASIIFLYIRIFPSQQFRRICYLVLVANICFFASTVLADCLFCRPISYRWNRMFGGVGSCGNQKPLDLFIGVFNLILDFTAVMLPMPVLWGLKVTTEKRVMLSCMFGMGTAVCGLTLYRIYDTTTISEANLTKGYAVIALLTSLEALLGVIVACLPVLKPIFNKMRGTAPKKGSGVREILKSGTLTFFIRKSQLSSDEETLTEISGRSEQEKKKKSKSDAESGQGASVTRKEISLPMTEKAEKMMGVKVQEIHVRRDIDVESVSSRGEGGSGAERWEGRQERW